MSPKGLSEANRTAYVFVFDGFADWEPASALAELRPDLDILAPFQVECPFSMKTHFPSTHPQTQRCRDDGRGRVLVAVNGIGVLSGQTRSCLIIRAVLKPQIETEPGSTGVLNASKAVEKKFQNGSHPTSGGLSEKRLKASR